MTRTIPRPLVIALLVSTVLLVALACTNPTSALWPNLAAEAVGLFASVCLVGWLIDRHDQQQWRAADEALAWRTAAFAANALGLIQNAFGGSTLDLLDGHERFLNSPFIRGHLFTRYKKRFVVTIQSSLNNPNASVLAKLSEALRTIASAADRLIGVSGVRLAAASGAPLLRLHACTQEATSALEGFHKMCALSPGQDAEIWDAIREQVESGVRSLCDNLIELGIRSADLVKANDLGGTISVWDATEA